MTTTPDVVPADAPRMDARTRPASAGSARGRMIVAAVVSGLIYGLYAALVAWLPYGVDRREYYLFDALGYSLAAPVLYVVAVALLFVLAATVWRAASDAATCAGADAVPRRWALVPPVLFALLLTPTQPLTSRDLFHYIMSGRILSRYATNSYWLPPSAFPGDPFFWLSNWLDYTSPYGPLWEVLGAGLTLLAGDSLLWSVTLFKLVALAGYLGCGALIWGILRRLGRPPLPGAVLWLWNPLVLWEFAGNGHNDVLMLAGMLFGLWLLLAGRPRAALVALTVAALVKYVALLLFPLVLWRLLRPLPGRRARARESVRLLWLPALLVAGALAPFWIGPETLGPLRESSEFYSSLPHILRIALEWFFGPLAAGRIVRGAILLALLAGYALAVREAGGGAGPRRVLPAATHAMLLLLVLWPFFVPWYIAWAVALAATLDERRAGVRVLLLSAMAALTYPVQLYLPERTFISVEWRSALSALLIFVPFLVTLAPWPWRDRPMPLARRRASGVA